MTSFKVNSKWKGFYDAPLPYGRREFTCKVMKMGENRFIGEGEDADGNFLINGNLSNFKTVSKDGMEIQTCDITFVKDYLTEDGYKGIEYNGTLTGEKIKGQYSFLWKKAFISKNVTGEFEMELIE